MKSQQVNFKKILVPTDFSEMSENALEFASYLSQRLEAKIQLLHVIESYKYNSALKDHNQFTDALEVGVEIKLGREAERVTKIAHLEVGTDYTKGKIYKQINKYAANGNYDLIVMGTHGASGINELEKFIMGSNAYRVVSASPCPVITVKDLKTPVKIDNLLLPIDSSKESLQKVGKAIYIAKLFSSTIHLVLVSSFFDEFVTSIGGGKIALKQLSNIFKRANIPFTSKIIRHENVGQSILRYSKEINADLVIMMAHQDSNWSEAYYIGSNTRNVVTNSEIPVLSLFPTKVNNSKKNSNLQEEYTL